jgi:oligo-1,6-glucosidase
MNREVLSKYPNVMSVSEGAEDSPEAALKFVDEDRKELWPIILKVSKLVRTSRFWFGGNTKKCLHVTMKFLKIKGYCLYFSQSRNQEMVSKFGTIPELFRELSSKMLSTLIYNA